jgi:hypothetical protein
MNDLNVAGKAGAAAERLCPHRRARQIGERQRGQVGRRHQVRRQRVVRQRVQQLRAGRNAGAEQEQRQVAGQTDRVPHTFVVADVNPNRRGCRSFLTYCRYL